MEEDKKYCVWTAEIFDMLKKFFDIKRIG